MSPSISCTCRQIMLRLSFALNLGFCIIILFVSATCKYELQTLQLDILLTSFCILCFRPSGWLLRCCEMNRQMKSNLFISSSLLLILHIILLHRMPAFSSFFPVDILWIWGFCFYAKYCSLSPLYMVSQLCSHRLYHFF